MGFFSFLGRVLFASIFILSAWQMFNEFSNNGGSAAAELSPKVAVLRRNLSSKLGVAIPDIDVTHLVAISLSLKGIGGLLFVFGSSVGAYLLLLQLAIITPVLYDFFNISPQKPFFGILLGDFLQHIALFGALLFFLGMKNTVPKRQPKKKAPKTKTY
ncbi:uncharacterized protein LOC111799718 [Cucurbita pepo subsp. pepo]|uniref:uncharacterized protein LOC111799718 n=1 Tax=Cucurbita pepo subsp. pepo TaxID=3664 RepID=UPI000C9D52A0|nr:uncharacterized protein LOC111799718 [Cucurbita pepo subsp. pepo]